MLAQNKVRLMTRLSIFEESKHGKAALRVCHFFRNDYIRWELIKTAISCTIGFVIMLGLYILYNIENLVKNATRYNYRSVGGRLLGMYIVVLVVFLVFTFILAGVRYYRYGKYFNRYDRGLKTLEEYYKNSDHENDAMEDDK